MKKTDKNFSVIKMTRDFFNDGLNETLFNQG